MFNKELKKRVKNLEIQNQILHDKLEIVGKLLKNDLKKRPNTTSRLEAPKSIYAENNIDISYAIPILFLAIIIIINILN
jgi:hypothetical protein